MAWGYHDKSASPGVSDDMTGSSRLGHSTRHLAFCLGACLASLRGLRNRETKTIEKSDGNSLKRDGTLSPTCWLLEVLSLKSSWLGVKTTWPWYSHVTIAAGPGAIHFHNYSRA